MSLWKEYLAVLVLITLSLLLIYGNSLSNGFVEIDDNHYLLQNEAIHQLDLKSVKYLFTDYDRDYNYVPLCYVVLAIEYHFFGPDPFYFHVVSLIIHLLNSFLAFILLRILTGNIFVSLFAALLFAVHPIQVETVSWITTTAKTGLSAFFYLLSLVIYCLGKFRTRQGFAKHVNIFSILTIVCFILASLVKTTAIILPVMFLSIDYFMASKHDRSVLPFMKKFLPDKIVYIPIILVFFYLNSVATENAPVILEERYNLLDHIAIIGHTLGFYITKTIVPTGLSVYYTPPVKIGEYFSFAYYACSIFGYLTLLILSFFSFKNVGVFLGTAFFFFPIALMLDTNLHTKDVIILLADRYHYVSLIGVLILIGFGINNIIGYLGKSYSFVPWVILLVVSLYFGYLSNSQTQVWENSVTLYENTVANQPCSEFFIRLGTAYREENNHEKAYQNYKEGFKRIDDNTRFMGNYTAYLTPAYVGKMYYQEGLINWSIKYYELDVELNPNDGNIWINLSRLYDKVGNRSKAEYCYRKAGELGVYQ